MAASHLGGVDLQAALRHYPQQDEDLLDIKDGVAVPCEDDHFAAFLFRALTAHTMAGKLLAQVAAKGIGQREGHQRQKDVSSDRPLHLLRIPLEEPALLQLSKGRVLDQAAQIIQIQHIERLIDGQARQEHLLLAGLMLLTLPLRHHHRVQHIADKALTVRPLDVLLISVLVVASQFRHPHHGYLAFPSHLLFLAFLDYFPLARTLLREDHHSVRFLPTQALCISRDPHVLLRRYHDLDAQTVLQYPKILPVEKAAIDEQHTEHPRPHILDRLADQRQRELRLMLLDRHHLGGHHQPQVQLGDDQHLEAVGEPLDLDSLLILIHLPLGVLLQPRPLALRRRLEVGGIQREVPFALLEESAFGQTARRLVQQVFQLLSAQALHGIRERILVHRPRRQIPPLAEAGLHLRCRVADQLEQRHLSKELRRHQVDRGDAEENLQLVGHDHSGNGDHHPPEARALDVEQGVEADLVKEGEEAS